MRKVYGLLAVQLTITTIIGNLGLLNRDCNFLIKGAVLLFTPGVKEAVQGNSWMLILSRVLLFAFRDALHYKRKETPINLILLAAFTVVQVLSSPNHRKLLTNLSRRILLVFS